ncbi:MAG TPA: single-stranded-DNA-specific exonuclease RecJ [Methylocella sp.]|nr:single-stranded-DNA-specific exonuclease RecJ [Methylocella sp.]
MNESRPFLSARAFLGVERSVLGRKWLARVDAQGEAHAQAIAQLHGTGDLLSRVLAGRGVTPEAAGDYLDPTLRKLLPDPCVLQDMEAAASRLARAVVRREKIAIFGDYDVDGACSAALLADYFKACGIPHAIHIPDRIIEGYGPNNKAIESLAAEGAKLLITVDCGTASHAPLAEAERLGLSPIVLDHHQAPEMLPRALIVNPNRQDDLSGQGQLCAAGIVFLTLVATQRLLRESGFFSSRRPEPDLLASLDLVALATIADVVPLRGLNRAFVTKGLALMQARGRVGLKSLLDVAGLSGPPTPYHLGFLIGPRINAGGRIGDAALGARLLSLTDPLEARQIAETLDELNRARRNLEQATLAAAEVEVLADPALDRRAAIVASGVGWHPGVAGLIAARLKEKFRRPAFAIAFDEKDRGLGSGRSIAGVDLGRTVRAAQEAGLLIKGGGHAMAAGCTLARERLDDFKDFLEAHLAEAVAIARADEALLIDAALSASAAKPDLTQSLARGGPYGAGNPEPVIVLPAHRLVEVVPAGDEHLRLRAEAADGSRIEGIAFRAPATQIGAALRASIGGLIHLAGTLSLDSYGGRERVQLRLIDLAPI